MSTMATATATPRRELQLGQLPEWQLADLYPGIDSPELKADLDKAEHLAKGFAAAYRGRVADLNGKDFGRAIAEYEALSELIGRIISFAGLVYSGDMVEPGIGRFFQSVQERVTAISSHTIFFTLDINRLEDAVLEAKLSAPGVAHFRPWLRDVRAFRDHQLSDEVERVLHERAVVGTAAWVRLFDETLAALRFDVNGNALSVTEAFNLLSEPEAETRHQAADAIAKVLGDNVRLFARITNTLVKEKEIDDQWRHFRHPLASRNLGNHVEDAVVDALVKAVRDSYGELSHRYYTLKAEWLGVDRLNYWDRNAPLPQDNDRIYRWDEARDVVLGAYGRFSPELAQIGRKFFDNAWIDAPARPNKASGAFAHPTVPSVHPYLLVNYLGKSRDVMTLAHELGHGVHQVLAGAQGQLMSDTPLTLAETASVFGEMLTFRAMLDGETDPGRRRILLASKVEDMLNTVVRQIAFHQFEGSVHAERRGGELSPDRIGEIWMGVQTESLGPAFRLDDDYRHFWTYIPHFVHTPFYVYAYAFGDCLVNSLYAAREAGIPDFEAKYLDLLRAGGTLRHKDLLAPFGLDASDPGFWKRGLSVVSGFIDQLERMT